jgi:hypothetical protein
MQNFRAATVRLEPEIWAEAQRERRPVSNYLRVIIEDAINPAAGDEAARVAS